MDFLLLAFLMVWSFVACFLPLREKALRSLTVANAVVTSLALLALAVPAIGGTSQNVLHGFFVMDQIRGLIAVPLVLGWIVTVVAFALWWGASFKDGTGTRPLFCLRSVSLIGVFSGIILVLLTSALPVVSVGLMLTFVMACVGVLFQVKDAQVLHHVRVFALGLGAALVTSVVGVVLLLIAGYKTTGSFVFTSADVLAAHMDGSSSFALFGIVLTGFAAMWFMGLLPGLAWYRQGMAHLPRGQRLLMRVFLPAVLFPHVLTLAAWAGSSGDALVQKMALVFSGFAALTLCEYLYKEVALADSAVVLLLGLVLVSLAYGPAGAIPALMFLIVLVLLGTTLFLAQGGVWWGARAKKLAVLLLLGVPFVSPLFVPLWLSLGYGIQMMPIVAGIAALIVVYAVVIFSTRILRAWSESEAHYPEMWSARMASLLMVVMVVYGCWFMYADALALMVTAVGK